MARNRNIDHSLLTKAKKNKADEFYTQLKDIESELVHYKNHFRDKVVYCNCDNASVSNFVKYFKDNFDELGLKKLISTSYKAPEDDLFKEGAKNKGTYYEYTNESEKRKKLKGDGDFRSEECKKILEISDIVVTNPPFSLFRDFVAHLIDYKKDFLVIGNVNCITYKEIFTLIKTNQAWLGFSLGRGISGFIVPDHYPLSGTEARIDEDGNRIVSPNNCLWLTNLDIDKRHINIDLVKTYKGNEAEHPTYDNYDAINVGKTKNIPKDYKGVMGVPITFLHKFNPEQFEIIKFRKGDDGKDLRINGKAPYFRILVRRVFKAEAFKE